MAAHQVPQVTQRRPVNFHSSNSYVPDKQTLNQLELKRLVELFLSNMHNMSRIISVFINFCVHMCIPVCISVCVAQRDAWLPIDVIIFHLQALISASMQRYFYYSVCLIFCVCVSVCFTKCLSLKKFQTLSHSVWLAEKCRKSHFLLKFLQKKLWRIKCHSVKGIGSSDWHKYNLSSRSGASFWINSACGVTVYQAGRHRAHVLESGMWFTLREKRWHDQLHQQKACRRC